jgi:hypothetical protein
MIYVFIKTNEKIFPIEKMCKVSKLVKGVIMEKPICFDRKQRVVLVKEK